MVFNMLRIILSIVAITLTLLLVIGIHEAGHAITAHLFGIKIKQIAIGFGKPLARWHDKAEREWLWGPWPLGGYVHLFNTRIAPVSPEKFPYCFDKKPIWVRTLVLISGVLANIITAWLAFLIIGVLGFKQIPPMIASVRTPSIAARAGIAAGDQIVAVQTQPTPSWQEVGIQFILNLGGETTMQVKNTRGSLREINLDLTQWPNSKQKKSLLNALGITPDLSTNHQTQVPGLSLHRAAWYGYIQVRHQLYFLLVLLKKLLLLIIPFSLLLGPLGLLALSLDSLSQGFIIFMYFIANLSLAVAVMNILPIPGLDGGALLYTVLEKIRKKPLSIAMEVLLHRLAWIFFILLLVQLFLNDMRHYLLR